MSETELLKKYKVLPYKRRIEKVTDQEGTYFICRYPELPGLMADGETRAEAIKNAQDAFDDYIAARLHWGEVIPEPEGAHRVKLALEIIGQVVVRAVEQEVRVEEPRISWLAEHPSSAEKYLRGITHSEADATIKQEVVTSG